VWAEHGFGVVSVSESVSVISVLDVGRKTMVGLFNGWFVIDYCSNRGCGVGNICAYSGGAGGVRGRGAGKRKRNKTRFRCCVADLAVSVLFINVS
jgi:hypothetical protein